MAQQENSGGYFDAVHSEGAQALRLNAAGAELVELLAGFFCTDEEIAGALKTDTATLISPLNRDTFLQRKKTGQENGKCALRRKQFDLADKSVTMAIFLGRQYLGQAGGAVQTQTEGAPPSRLELALRHLAQTVTPADADTPEGIADEEEGEWIG